MKRLSIGNNRNSSTSDLHSGLKNVLEEFRSKFSEDVRSELEDVKEMLTDIQLQISEQHSHTHAPGTFIQHKRDKPPVSQPAAAVLTQVEREDSDGSSHSHQTFTPVWSRRAWEENGTYTALLDSTDLRDASSNYVAEKGRSWRCTKSRYLVNSTLDNDCSSIDTFVKSSRFEYSVGVLVLVNSIFIGLEANVQCVFYLKPPTAMSVGLEVAEFFFAVLFLSEWCLRFSVFGTDFFIMDGWKWNVFDTLVVLVQVTEQILYFASRTSQSSGRNTFGILRMLRLIRITRMVRLLHLFDELKVLVSSILASFHALVWAVFLMLAMLYLFSVYFAERVMQIKNGHLTEQLAYFFGNVPRTALTLMECMLGGLSWDEPVNVLFQDVGFCTGSIAVIFITMGLFVLVNIVTGVFIDRTMRTAGTEEEKRVAEDLAVAFGLSDNGLDIDSAADHLLDFDSFKDKLQQPGLRSYFEQINLHVDDDHLRKFFSLLDTDGSGDVSASEMYFGCLRLRGTVRAVDIALQAYDHQVNQREQQRQLLRLERLLCYISQKVAGRKAKSKSHKMNKEVSL